MIERLEKVMKTASAKAAVEAATAALGALDGAEMNMRRVGDFIEVTIARNGLVWVERFPAAKETA